MSVTLQEVDSAGANVGSPIVIEMPAYSISVPSPAQLAADLAAYGTAKLGQLQYLVEPGTGGGGSTRPSDGFLYPRRED